jgi:hypothetical protein
MYSFCFMDATYRIALFTNSKVQFSEILKAGALDLFEGVYETQKEANAAIAAIKIKLEQ